MTRTRRAPLYMWAVTLAAVGLCLVATALEAPASIHDPKFADTLASAVILLVLTFLSSISPMQTKVGLVTVGLAPLFGAFIYLPAWLTMWVAALGTVDERIPGRDLPWYRFLFNRGMFVISYGLPSLVFHSVSPKGPLAFPLALIGAVAAIVVLNVGQVSLAFSLMQSGNVAVMFRRMLEGRWLTYIALPLIGYLIYVLIQQKDLAKLEVFLLYGPLLVYRSSLQKQNRLDRWLRDSFIMQSRIVDKRDGQTFGHSQRVGELCEAVARELHLSENACNTIRLAGILHDLGKIAIPDSILLKPAKLTPEEYEIIKIHPIEGANILAEHPEQRDVATIVRHHHEKWDGTGYPDGLMANEIPIGARIVDACDAFDTITQARVFRPTVKTPAEAIHELRQLAGSWYDPGVIDGLERIVAERWGVPVPAPVLAPKPPGYRQLLSGRPFRLLLLGQAVSYFGDMMNTAGLAIMLFVLTGSPSVVALGLIAKAAPTILFGLVAGSVVDRFNRQRLMVGADLVRALLTVMIPFLAVRWLPGVFLAVFLIATASSFFNPAKQALIPNLVPANLLVRANGLVSSSEKTMELIGYSAAGLIAAAISWIPLFIIDAGTYVFSAASLLGITDTRKAGEAKPFRLVSDIVEGSRFILSNTILRSTMGLTCMSTVFVGLTYPTLVVLAYRALHSGPAGYGLLEAVIGAGAIVGALAVPLLMARFGAGMLILAGVGGIGLGYAAAGLFQNLEIAVIALLLTGLSSTVYYVPLISVTQREAPDRVRGRVMSSRFLLVQLGLLTGMAISGPLAEKLGAPLVFVAAGGLLLCAAILGAAFRDLRAATLREEGALGIRKAPMVG